MNIGILPGATGTQRFPRLTSLKLALDIIPTGRRIQAEEALKHGAIDQVTFTIGDIIPTGQRIQARGSQTRGHRPGNVHYRGYYTNRGENTG